MKDFKVSNLTKTYGIKTLFENISFTIREKEHVGLIGKNGTGKSSLLSILAKRDVADSGVIECANDYTIGYLSQDTIIADDMSVFEVVYNGQSPLLNVVKNYEQVLYDLSKNPQNEQLQKAYQVHEAQMTSLNAWDYDVKIKTILTKLGLTELFKKVGELSGGQKKHVGMAQVLIQEPDLLILDEPTNHLDYESIVWLEEYLKAYNGALLLVTHDRYFLEHVVTKIFELEHGKLNAYVGNYETYLEQKSIATAIQEKNADKLEKLYRSELVWFRKSARARTTKQKAREDRFGEIDCAVRNRVKTQEMSLEMDSTRLGKRVFEMEHVALSIAGKSVLNDLTYIVQNRDRIGVLGDNGVGKSTFLNALASIKTFDSGVFKIGETVKLAYYKQQNDDLPLDKRVVHFLQQVAEEVEVKDGVKVSVTELLEKFLFPRYMHGELISSLSGGEKRRLYLLKLLLEKPNVLLLDEPTNDLDIATLQVLENYLETFNGAVIVVSHDRYFLDRTCHKLLHLTGTGECLNYLGLASEVLSDISQQKKEQLQRNNNEVSCSKLNDTPLKASAKKMTYHEKKEWETIESDIERLEIEIANVNQLMINVSSDFEQLQQLQQQLDELEEQLLYKMERWEYLSEIN